MKCTKCGKEGSVVPVQKPKRQQIKDELFSQQPTHKRIFHTDQPQFEPWCRECATAYREAGK